jgi:hypothetical protein
MDLKEYINVPGKDLRGLAASALGVTVGPSELITGSFNFTKYSGS